MLQASKSLNKDAIFQGSYFLSTEFQKPCGKCHLRSIIDMDTLLRLFLLLCECDPFVENLIKTLFGELGDSFSLFQFFAYDYGG